MIRALTTAATGLEAQAANIERISNDLANVNTDGYKRSRSEFQDLMYETIKEPGQQLGAGSQTPVGVQTGLGVRVGAAHKIFEQGPARMTYHDYDIMIEGDGFFPIQTPKGDIAYTRTGSFHRDSTGKLVTGEGGQFIPTIVIPTNAVNFIVNNSGEMKAILPGQGEVILGQVQLVRFPNEEGLNAMGNSLYAPTLASGAPQQGIPGEDGFGTLQQGALEGSNVNVATSMVDMITTQRAYEMQTKVMGVADKMWEATANIK